MAAMRRALMRLIAFWPLLMALGWFASTARIAGHLHAIHERAAHLDNAAGDWAGDCDLCRTVVATAESAAPQTAPQPPATPPRFAALGDYDAALVAATRFPPLAARPPPAAS